VNPERLNFVYVVSSNFMLTILESPVTKFPFSSKNSGDDRQFIVIAPQRFFGSGCSQVKVSQDGQPAWASFFLEKTG